MKNRKTTVVFLLAIALVLSGCSLLVPDEYKDGVKIDRNYPDDELPVYENAIVFSSIEDDDEITLMMGTKDELDDIVDFYKDFFEDKEIVLTDEDEGRDDYYAEGHVTGYDFELQAQQASGKWEEKLFRYVIEIAVVPAEDPIVEPFADASTKILGTWAMTQILLEGRDVTDDFWEYLICTFYADGTGYYVCKIPEIPEYIDEFTWEISGNEFTFVYDGVALLSYIETLTDDTFTEITIDTPEYDTTIYTRVEGEDWRPHNDVIAN